MTAFAKMISFYSTVILNVEPAVYYTRSQCQSVRVLTANELGGSCMIGRSQAVPVLVRCVGLCTKLLVRIHDLDKIILIMRVRSASWK